MTEAFELHPGRIIGSKYEVLNRIGSGAEGEVYKVCEIDTQIERAAKLFFPLINDGNATSRAYAIKLHKLKDCSVVTQYQSQESITIRRIPVTALISEYVEGEMLYEYIERFPGNRLPIFQAIHMLCALISGVEQIHGLGEYHGDLHSANIMVQKLGLTYDIKLIDFYDHGKPTLRKRQSDICDAVKVFHEVLGGQRYYSKLPPQVRSICCGLKKSLILSRFPTATALKLYIENQRWD